MATIKQHIFHVENVLGKHPRSAPNVPYVFVIAFIGALMVALPVVLLVVSFSKEVCTTYVL